MKAPGEAITIRPVHMHIHCMLLFVPVCCAHCTAPRREQGTCMTGQAGSQAPLSRHNDIFPVA